MKKRELRGISLLLVITAILIGYTILAMCMAPAKAEEMRDEEGNSVKTAAEILQPAQTQIYDVPLDQDLQAHIIEVCAAYDLDPALVLAVIGQESNYDPSAIGDGGKSKGLMQIQQAYHKKRMDKLGCDDLLNPYQNVIVGVDILAELIDRGGLGWGLMAYNGGIAYADAMTERGSISEYAESVVYLAQRLGQ